MQGRVVIVTGGAGGVGSVVTKRWLAEGASVLVIDHADANLKRLRESLSNYDRLATLATDITTEMGATTMVEYAREKFGQAADTLLHLVGGFDMGPIDGDNAVSVWERMKKLNLDSTFHCYRAMIPTLKARQGGWIVGLASRAALQPPAQLWAYASTKAALIAFSQSVAAEVRDENIHVNVILPSTIDTPANRAAMGDAAAEKWVSPDDIADATLFLCSDRAKSIFGATLEVYAKV